MGPTGEVARQPHRVVVVGGGFAGLYAARSLGIDPEVRLTLVDRRNFHLFQPLLYQVATGALSPGDVAAPLRETLRRSKNTTVLLGDVTDIDVAGRSVVLGDALGRADSPDRFIPYDTLVVASGLVNNYFGKDEW